MHGRQEHCHKSCAECCVLPAASFQEMDICGSSSSVTSQRFPELAHPFFGHVHTEIGLSNLKAILPRKESSHMSALIYNVQIIKPNS